MDVTRTAVAYARPNERLEPPPDLEVIAVITGELGDALRLIANGGAQTLFAQSLHSVAGSLGELTRLLTWLDEYGATLVTTGPEFDSHTAAGRQTAAVLHAIDHSGRSPEHPRRPRGRPGLVHTTPEVAERIAALRDRGLSLRAIAEHLNSEGIPTPRGGAMWRASSVQSAIGYQRPRPPAPGLPRPPRPHGHTKPPKPHQHAKPPKPHQHTKPTKPHQHPEPRPDRPPTP